MSFNALAAVGTLVFTFVNFLTYVRSKNVNGIVTQLIAWIAGIAAILIAAHTQFAPDVKFGSQQLSKLDWQSQVFLGLIATSILSTVNEVKKAIDNNDSAAKSPLIKNSAANTTVTTTSNKRTVAPTSMRGQAKLVAGSVTVASTGVTESSQIMVTPQDNSTLGSLRVSEKGVGSFTITSSVPSDSGVVAYEVWEPST